MLYIFWILGMLAFKWAIVDQCKCILWCVRILLANLTPFSTTSETLSYNRFVFGYQMCGIAIGQGKTTFVNASIFGHHFKPVNTPVVFHLETQYSDLWFLFATNVFNLAIFYSFRGIQFLYCKGQHHLLANVSKARIKMQEMWLVTSFLLVLFSLWFVLPLNIGGGKQFGLLSL